MHAGQVAVGDMAPAPSAANGIGPELYAPLAVTRPRGKPEDIYDALVSDQCAVLKEIVDREGPISLRVAARRLGAFWGIGRVSPALQDKTKQLALEAGLRIIRHQDELFLWPARQDPEQYERFRVAGDDPESRRDARDLPPEEVANAARYVLHQQGSLPLEDLVKETARLLGYQRTGVQVDQACRRGIDRLIEKGLVRNLEGMVVTAQH